MAHIVGSKFIETLKTSRPKGVHERFLSVFHSNNEVHILQHNMNAILALLSEVNYEIPSLQLALQSNWSREDVPCSGPVRNKTGSESLSRSKMGSDSKKLT